MPKFTRTKQNFTCRHCGQKVIGTGFTNHCPKCLYSKHVDVNPGDRGAACFGLMKPILVEIVNLVKGQYTITHQCEKCGVKKRNKTIPEDNFDEILKIAKSIAKI
jgi:hypothetical protein